MSRSRPEPTTTSFAMLGLLALKPWTTYELARQMDRGLGKFWPRARSNVFVEPKRLVAMGYATATSERVGRRARTVYAITPAGRRALEDWLGHAGEPPSLAWDQLVRVFFAEHGTKSDLLATLGHIKTWAQEEARAHRKRARAYLDGEGAFPERMMVHQLTGSFLADFAAMVGDWADRSEAIVRQWPRSIRAAQPDLETFERIARHGRTTPRGRSI